MIAHPDGLGGAWLHRVASNALVYDAVQIAAGRPLVSRVLRKWFMGVTGTVVDVGGGTGHLKQLLPPVTRHVCLELDAQKLDGYRRRFADAIAARGDVLHLPLATRHVRTAAFIAVSHHLDDAALDVALSEMARVLSADGTLFFFDAVAAPDRAASRWLWQHDRGSHPRMAARLEELLKARFDIIDGFAFAVWHAYVGYRCRPRPA